IRVLGAVDKFTGLVCPGGLGHDKPVARRAGVAQVLDLQRIGNRVPCINRLEPAQIAHARRGPDVRHILAAGPQGLDVALVAKRNEAHADRAGLPARRAQAAEVRARRRFLVGMKELRVVAPCERLDALGRESVGAEFPALANSQVLEKLHTDAPAGADVRRANIMLVREVMTQVPISLSTSKNKPTNPRSGRLCDAFLSRTVTRTRSTSPGRTGASQRISSTPGAPMDEELSTKPSAMMRIMIAQVCQPDAHNPPTSVARAASSSRCIGCGSNSAANALISSALTSWRPYSLTWPTAKSSQKSFVMSTRAT